jgi:hypothetical protein
MAKKKFDAGGASRPGAPPRYGDRQLMTVRLPRPLYEALKEATRKSGRSLTAEIEAAIAAGLQPKAEAGNSMLEGRIKQLNEQIIDLHDFMRQLSRENAKLKDDLAQAVVQHWKEKPR